MSDLQKISWIFGSLLLGFSVVLMCDRSRTGRRRDYHVEQLAENLKQAWAEHHIP